MGLGSSEDAVLKLRVDARQAQEELRKTKQDFSQWGADFAKSMGYATAAIVGTTLALGKLAADGDRARDVYRNLTINIDAARDATGREVAALQLAEAANKTRLAGLNLTSEAFATLAGFAKQAGDATGQEFGQVIQQVTEALVSGSTETLRRYGLEIEKTGDRAQDTARMFDVMREKLGELDGGLTGTGDAVSQLKARLTDLYDNASRGFADQGPLSRTLEGMTDLTRLFGEGEQGAVNFGRALQGSVMLSLGGLAGATVFAIDQIKQLLRWLGIMRSETPGAGGGGTGAGGTAVPQEGGGGFSLSYAPTAAGANSPEATLREAVRSGMMTRAQAVRQARRMGFRLYDMEQSGGTAGGSGQQQQRIDMEFTAADVSQFQKYGASGMEEAAVQGRIGTIRSEATRKAEEEAAKMAEREAEARRQWQEAEGKRLQENWDWSERELQQREQAIEQYAQMGAAVAQVGVAQLLAGKNAKEAFGAMAEALAQMCLVKALFEGAEAVAAAVSMNAPAAAGHAQAAAMYGAAAALAGGFAAATSSGGGRGGGRGAGSGVSSGAGRVGPVGGYGGGGGGEGPVHISVTVNAAGDVVDDATVRRLGRVVREAGRRGYLGGRKEW